MDELLLHRLNTAFNVALDMAATMPYHDHKCYARKAIDIGNINSLLETTYRIYVIQCEVCAIDLGSDSNIFQVQISCYIVSLFTCMRRISKRAAQERSVKHNTIAIDELVAQPRSNHDNCDRDISDPKVLGHY